MEYCSVFADSPNFLDIIELAQAIQDTAQLRHAGHFDRHFHMRGIIQLVRLSVYCIDIDFLVAQYVKNIAQQILPIYGFQTDIDRIGFMHLFAPLDIDQATTVAAVHFENITAITPVNSHAAPLRDVADDAIARSRRTTPRQFGEQIADTLDVDVFMFFAEFALNRDLIPRHGLRGAETLSARGDLCRTDIAPPDCRIKLIDTLELELFGQCLVINVLQIQPAQILFQRLASDAA